MMRLSVKKKEEVVTLVFDDANTLSELQKCSEEYGKIIDQYAKSSERVIFKVDGIDMDGMWLNTAQYWLTKRPSIHFVCSDENILDTIIVFFGPEATFHKTMEEAISALK